MSKKDFVSVVHDDQGQKFLALEGMVTINTLFGDPAKLAISQSMMVTAFGTRLVTTVWMFPYKTNKKTFEKVGYVGSTMLNPCDQFSYKQAVINALTDAGHNFMSNNRSNPWAAFIRRYDYDTDRIDAAIARWARSEGRRLFSNEHGALGDMDNNPRIKQLNSKLNDSKEDHNYVNRVSMFF